MTGTASSWPHGERPDARQLVGTSPVCFDTMIVTGLVQINRTQMLLKSMASRARIVPAVAGELRGHARSLPPLMDLIPWPNASSPRALGDHIALTRAEAQRAFDYQRSWNGLAATQQDPKRDRGEAEVLAAIDHRGWPGLSHDHKAVGPKGARRVDVLGIPELLMLFAAEGQCLANSAWAIYCDMIGATPELLVQGWNDDAHCERVFMDCCIVLAEAAAGG